VCSSDLGEIIYPVLSGGSTDQTNILEQE